MSASLYPETATATEKDNLKKEETFGQILLLNNQ